MIRRRPFVMSLILAAALAGLAGCASGPVTVSPSPSFSSDEAAFAAAEETYRAYVDALNHVDLSDPETFEAVYAWTTGELNASDRESFSGWHAEGYRIDGAASVTRVDPVRADLLAGSVILGACYDVSAVTVYDSDGASLIRADRPNVQSLEVRLVPKVEALTGLAIESIGPLAPDRSC